MKQNKLAKALLDSSNLSPSDTARLALEAMEALGELTSGKGREEIMMLLRRVIKQGVKEVIQAEQTVSFEEAAWASVEARNALRPTSRRDLRNYVRRMLRVENIAKQPLRSMSTSLCRCLLSKAFNSSTNSYKKGRAILSSIFTYGIRQEWCDTNPVSRIEVPKVAEKQIIPLTMEEVERLTSAAEQPEHRAMRFSLRLMLYSGIRPSEVSRLHADDIQWEDGQVIIRSNTSKTGGGRAVPLRGMHSIRKMECLIPRNWQRRWQALRRAAGFRHNSWIPDVCRHSFASYHAAHFKNLPALQIEMGHRDLNLLRTRYIYPVTTRASRHYWTASSTPEKKNAANNKYPPSHTK